MDVHDLLHPRDILLRGSAHAKRQLISVLSLTLAARCGISDDTVRTALFNRESLGATGIGHGIAIPHALLPNLVTPAAVFAVLDRPISYVANDEQLVDVALAVIWPRERAREFTPALARFCRHMSHPDLLRTVRSAKSPRDVLECFRRTADAGCQQYPAAPTIAPTMADTTARGHW